MATPTGKSDYFGTFLGSVSESAAPNESASLQKVLLKLLARGPGPWSVRILLDEAQAPASMLIGALNELQGADLVAMTTIDGDEQVRLTDLGRRIAG